jgi:transposase
MERTPLKEIQPNWRCGAELSPYARGIIKGMRQKGAKFQEIGDALQIPKSTVQYTVKKQPLRQEGKSLARPGQPPKLSSRDERSILRAIRTDPFISYKDIREKTGVSVSDTTIRKCLKKSGYGHWRAKKRPQLTMEAAKARLEWAKARENWGVEEFQRIIWSDECSIQLGKGKGQQWVW